MKAILTQIWHVVKNKYVIAILIFLVFFLFIDENNLFVTMRLQRRVHRLHAEEASLYQSYTADSIKAQSLQYDLDAIERYGRETYYMKRSDEDIYIINHKK